jgi:hypothetical protein
MNCFDKEKLSYDKWTCSTTWTQLCYDPLATVMSQSCNLASITPHCSLAVSELGNFGDAVNINYFKRWLDAINQWTQGKILLKTAHSPVTQPLLKVRYVFSWGPLLILLETLTLMHLSYRADAMVKFVGFWQRLLKRFLWVDKVPEVPGTRLMRSYKSTRGVPAAATQFFRTLTLKVHHRFRISR